MTLTEVFSQCLQHFRAGRLPQAESLTRELLQAMPDNARAWHLQGVIVARRGRIDDALGLFAKALTLSAEPAPILHDQGIAFSRLSRPTDALESLERAVLLAPDFSEAWNTRGRVLLDLGRIQDALASFDHALKERPDYPDALANRGDALRLLQENAGALASYERALALKPAHAKAACGCGLVLSAMGRLQEALQAFDRAIRISPDLVDAHNGRGMALSRLGEHAAALASFARALSLQPDNVEALLHNGHALRATDRHDEALESYDRALAVNRALPEALVAKGHLLSHLDRHDEALLCYDAALALAPDSDDARMFRANALRVLSGEMVSSETHFLRGDTLRFLGRFEEAVASYDAALALRPDDAHAWNHRGIALQELHEFSEALHSFDKALEVQPHAAGALANRGAALRSLGRLEEAIAAAQQALLHDPRNVGAHTSLGHSFRVLGRVPDALAHFDAAIEASPDEGSLRFNRAACLLLDGDYERGWKEYEWRWTLPGMSARWRKIPESRWLGDQPIAGKTILLYGEQGHGDNIQFCRYIPLLAAQGATVVLGISPLIRTLMQQVEGVHAAFDREEDTPPFDLHSPLLSLPLAFGTRLDSVPRSVPYIQPPGIRSSEWAKRLGPRQGLRIGLAWSGNPDHKDDRNRSIPLHLLEGLARPDARFYCLQRELRPDDVPAFALRRDIEFLGSELRDFCDTAAVIAHMDLVISVDTAVLHLAGAMGRPAWGLLPFVPDWRWMLNREDSPWYPTMRLFRQSAPGDWPGVIHRLRDALAALRVAAPSPGN